MPDKIRLYGDVSPEHETKFLFIKGAFGCKNNGEALEIMIERLTPQIRKEISSGKVKRPA
ncbi:hypothetical protein GWN26_01615 [Candidatus Saccharibacteria bacterium]|nr:hypothetical protein [Candidatus Saccharibacteria bacterium]NIW80975.1 hypothetical protein [Calditrichia bacterium]